MGINVCLKKEPAFYEDHPEWDWIRYAGDRDLSALFGILPTEEKMSDECSWVHRPSDFHAWRKYIDENMADRPNPDRFKLLLDLLEQDSSYWIYISY